MILTLQQLDGIGNKTILKIANQAPTSIGDFGQLCDFWKSLKGKKLSPFLRVTLNMLIKPHCVSRLAASKKELVSFPTTIMTFLKRFVIVPMKQGSSILLSFFITEET